MEAQAENGGTKRRNEPLSLEEIKKRKLEQEKQLSKPTFMTKEQREAAALARRAAQVEAMRAQQGSDRRVAQMATGMKTEEEEKKEADRARDRDRDRRDDRDRDRDRGGRDRDRRDDRDRDRSRDDRDRRDRDRRDRSRSRERRDRDRRDRDRDRDRGRDREEERRKEEERKKQQEEERKAAQMRAQMEKEVAAIKAQYMGMQKNQKKFIKPSEKFKLARMDTWDASDDTTKEAAPLQGAGTFRPLFGRGYVGGVDRNDQSKWLGVNNGGGSPAPRANVVPDGAEIVAGPGAPRERPLTREEIVRRLEEEAEERDDVPAREKTEEEKLEEEMAAAAAGAEGGEEGQAAAAAPAAAEVGAALKDRSTAGIVGGRLKQEKHWSEKKLEEMTERDWRIMREDHEISCRGNRIANPIRNWEEAQLQPSLHEAITVKAKYDKPTPIQMQAIPIGLSRRDIIGVAETGSGKTAAFVIPMLMYIKTVCPPMTQENAAEGPYAVVMAPTRELAQQIEEEARKFAEAVGLRVYSIVGGINIEQQGFDMRDGVEIIIATPGRMADCIEKRYIVLNQCNYVVLDEADRMLELGFEPALNYVLDAMPASNLRPENEEEMDESLKIYRQTFMFSATMPASVERLAKKYLRNPITIQVGTPGQAVDRIKQVVMVVTEAQKKDRLVELVRRAEPPIMIFVGSKKMADFVARGVNHEAGKRAAAIHSGKMQDQREEALNSFRERRVDVLVATDVAGRGIDIKGVKHVINYDMPSSIETYTHRIGRTGRAGATGTATSLLTLNDTDIMYDLKQTLLATKNAVPKELNDCPEANTKPGTVSDKPRRQQGPKFAI